MKLHNGVKKIGENCLLEKQRLSKANTHVQETNNNCI